ncbi:MAG: hypothetical protein LBC12_05575 [Nitrososphaerota archaeon]|jgi:hypothetical protein|nr:hypothetical protein [Nitrososphaerota archaeon]
MNRKAVVTIFFCSILITVLFVGIHTFYSRNSTTYDVDVYVGVDAAYDNMIELKACIDQVKDFTNIFVLGSTGITLDAIKLNEMCEYISARDLNFATYTHTTENTTINFNQSAWTTYAKQHWSDKFLGLYSYDEPGGHQIDVDHPYMIVTEADSYSDAANKYTQNLHNYISEFLALNSALITSDYVLYEYGYRAGYDLVMAEYAWNHSRPLNTALCRGSATMHGKEWGVMLTYTYDIAPYLASGSELYQDMVTAYQNGAKYILIFDYAMETETLTAHGILQQEHLDALRQFWEYVKTHPRPNNPVNERVAYVLPPDFGYGFRGSDDWIWGLWKNSVLSNKIWTDVNTYSQQYGQKFDILYADSLNFDNWAYSKLIYWNGTVQTKP